MHSLQLNPPLEVTTPHGKGWVLILTDYGPTLNAVWTVANKADGRIRHYDTKQISLSENFTFELNVKERLLKKQSRRKQVET